MERQILTWQREQTPDGLHPLFDDILRRQLMFERPPRRTKEDHGKPQNPRPPASQ